jgi:NAD(P) transhydrogenase subunit alpha
MKVGVPKETGRGETRVSLTPAFVPTLTRAGLEVEVQAGAGGPAGYDDAAYVEKGARIVPTRQALFGSSDIILQVRTAATNPDAGGDDLKLYRREQAVIGTCDPLVAHTAIRSIAERGVTLFSLELMPRITRAQSMDILSSMATIAGYKAVLLAADALPKMFPMMMTAAGTIAPARVFVLGAGVAGLQAIATSRRLGAIVHAYDVRPAVREQVESLGGKFVQLDLETSSAEDAGGYAKALGDDFYRKQREMMFRVVAESDVVITTAAVPGKKAPILVTTAMVEGMSSGAVVVDLAAERGGNCELTRPGETVVHNGVTILGPLNLPAMVPHHASQLYAKNISTFLLHLVRKGALEVNLADEITAGTLVTKEGKVVHPTVLEAMGAVREGGASS